MLHPHIEMASRMYYPGLADVTVAVPPHRYPGGGPSSGVGLSGDAYSEAVLLMAIDTSSASY